MKKLLLVGAMLALPLAGRGASTIDATNHYAWGANIGWTNWLPSAADGVVVSEYVCSGYVYAANVGWINLGSGSPVNHIQYRLTAEGTGTRLKLTHKAIGLIPPEHRDGMPQGWEFGLKRIREIAESRKRSGGKSAR